MEDMCRRMGQADRYNRDCVDPYGALGLEETVWTQTVTVGASGGGGTGGRDDARHVEEERRKRLLRDVEALRGMAHISIAAYPMSQWSIAVPSPLLQDICREYVRMFEESAGRLEAIKALCK